MDEGLPGRCLGRLRLGVGRLIVGATLDDARAQPLDGPDLQLVCIGGNEHRCRDREGLRTVGDAHAVIAGRRRHDAPGPLLRVHADDLVEGAPDFEGANRLDAFQLQVDVAAGLVRECARVLERSGGQVAGKVTSRFLDCLRSDRG